MGIESEIKTVLILLVVVAAIVTFARRFTIPYPILLIIGGLALGFVPLLPTIILDPQIILLLFLPPLLYWQALNLSFRDFRANLRSILLLSIGLVLVTIVAVAAIAHSIIPNLSWPAAFVLGAIVSPTDTVATATITERLTLPRRVTAILEGESLVNDATALVAYSLALASVSSTITLPQIGLQFLYVSVGGIAVGLLVGYGVGQVRRYLHDPLVENTVSLLTGFAAYIPAQSLNVSGVLAVMALGIYLGRRGPRFVSSETRLQAEQLWQVVVFLVNGLIFILVGLQLHTITLSALRQYTLLELVLYAAVVSAIVIVVRILWVFPGAFLPITMSRRLRKRALYPPWRNIVILGWTGMRGGLSLAAALAIPTNFPGKDLITFLTFCVILATLLIQGLSLSTLIRRLQAPDDGLDEREESKARFKVAQVALRRLDELAKEPWVQADHIDDLRTHYSEQSNRFSARFHHTEGNDQEERAVAYSRLKREIISAERGVLIELRGRGVINDEVLRRVQHDLDLEEVGLSS